NHDHQGGWGDRRARAPAPDSQSKRAQRRFRFKIPRTHAELWTMGHAFWTRSTSRAEAAGIPATCAPTVSESTRTNGSGVMVLQHDNPNSQNKLRPHCANS